MFKREKSAKRARLTHSIRRAEQVFENSDAALDWLNSKNAALAGASPLSLLDTDAGDQKRVVADLGAQ